MLTRFALLTATVLITVTTLRAQTIEWSRELTGISSTVGAVGHLVRPVTAGGYMMLGSTGQKVYLARLNAQGQVVWEKILGEGERDAAVGFAEVVGDFMVLYNSTKNDKSVPHLTRIDDVGNVLWDRAVFTPGSSTASWLTYRDGRLGVVEYERGTFITVLDTNDAPIWRTDLGNNLPASNGGQ